MIKICKRCGGIYEPDLNEMYLYICPDCRRKDARLVRRVNKTEKVTAEKSTPKFSVEVK